MEKGLLIGVPDFFRAESMIYTRSTGAQALFHAMRIRRSLSFLAAVFSLAHSYLRGAWERRHCAKHPAH